MTSVRRSIWSLGSAADPWHPVTLGYARAVRAMQALPISDPRSWRYQAAIHGLAGTAPPTGAPWNECQHATWYFLPWHRMYLYQFERIVRSFVVAAGGPADWALPYWDYEAPGANALPRAFRTPTLPDGTANPLFVAQRAPGINAGNAIPASVTSSRAAMATAGFTTPTSGAPMGFGGPRTGFAHFGPAPGALENQPHNIMHVVVGGNGLMSDPDTAALDPIFWLHHANIDRLWEHWRLAGQANPTTQTWTRRSFRLRDETGRAVRMRVSGVLDTVAQLDYRYQSMAAPPHAAAPVTPPVPETAMAAARKPVTVGRSPSATELPEGGASALVPVGPLPRRRGAAAAEPMRFSLELADIEGEANPGVVYGVYVNLPDRPTEAQLEEHRVGLVSLFGIEHSRGGRGTAAQPLRYVFDVTGHVQGAGDAVRVALLPLPGLERPSRGAAAASPVRVGTIALLAG